jgi:hypothetical protein
VKTLPERRPPVTHDTQDLDAVLTYDDRLDGFF